MGTWYLESGEWVSYALYPSVKYTELSRNKIYLMNHVFETGVQSEVQIGALRKMLDWAFCIFQIRFK